MAGQRFVAVVGARVLPEAWGAQVGAVKELRRLVATALRTRETVQEGGAR